MNDIRIIWTFPASGWQEERIRSGLEGTVEYNTTRRYCMKYSYNVNKLQQEVLD